jgi:glycosyltransferase involved in cell wall biosynthesis
LATTLTIAIPTHNRAATLRQTLASVARLSISQGIEADCVVIDNASNDDTAAIVEDFARDAAIPTRRVMEPRLGSSFARNRAVDETRAEFLFFVDDDAIAEPNWATELLSDLRQRNLDVACGMVLPQWSSPPPAWLGPSLWVKLAVHDRPIIEASAPQSVETLANYFSANVGFRRSAFDRFGKFREDLGVVGGNPMSGEDTELFARIIARGGRIGFAPRAIVHHMIPAERMTRSYLRRKSFAYGVGSAFAGGKSHNSVDKLVRNAIRMAAAAARSDRERMIHHELECANFFGYWKGRLFSRLQNR